MIPDFRVCISTRSAWPGSLTDGFDPHNAKLTRMLPPPCGSGGCPEPNIPEFSIRHLIGEPKQRNFLLIGAYL
jgi:hypothetical protein